MLDCISFPCPCRDLSTNKIRQLSGKFSGRSSRLTQLYAHTIGIHYTTTLLLLVLQDCCLSGFQISMYTSSSALLFNYIKCLASRVSLHRYTLFCISDHALRVIGKFKGNMDIFDDLILC